jgi:hypothetical protein
VRFDYACGSAQRDDTLGKAMSLVCL